MGFTLWIMGFLLDSLDSRADEMGVPRSQRDWGFIGYIAFGKAARFLFASCMFFDLAGSALVLMSIVIEQLPFLLPIRHSATAVLSCILAILFCLMPKKAFSWMVVVGMASQLFLVLGLVITGVQLHTLDETATDQVVLDLSGLPRGFGIALLCFLAHSEAPLIYQLMEDRRQWSKVVVYSMTLTEAFLLSFGILGYGFFGSSVAQSIAGNPSPAAGCDHWPVWRSLAVAKPICHESCPQERRSFYWRSCWHSPSKLRVRNLPMHCIFEATWTKHEPLEVCHGVFCLAIVFGLYSIYGLIDSVRQQFAM